MYWQGAAALLLGVSTQMAQAAAQVITITQYPSTCSAIYTSGSRSVTIVQSTVTVSPVPWNDNMANGGTAFALQAVPDGLAPVAKRQAPVPRWVLPNGYLTTDGSKAAQYMIKNDQLTTATGGWISTFEGIPYGTFGVSTTIGNLNATFRITEGKLVWTNTAFTDGTAKLFQTSDGVQDSPHIVARFYGAINSAWTPYSLYARPVSAAVEGTSPLPGMSYTAVVSSIGGGMSSMQPPPSISPYQTPSYTYQPTTEGQVGQPSGSFGGNIPSSSAAQSPPPVSTSIVPTSPDGICGGDSGFYCSGSDCCGQYGYCGTGSDYCGAGCQSGFGTCWYASTSWGSVTSGVAPTSNPPVISTPASSGPMGSVMSPPASMPMSSPPGEVSPTTSYQPAPTYARCPADDTKVITDGYDKQYTIGCGKDTTIGSYANQLVSRGFNECFDLCDERTDCMAFTYQGGVNGVGPGICYFKNQMVDFVTVNNDRMVGAVRVMVPSGSSSGMASSTSFPSDYTTYTAPSTPIGPDNPGGPQSRPSSSSAMETEVVSSMSMSMSMSMSGMPDMTVSSSSAPSPTMPVSPNGHCGTQGNGGTPEAFTCTDSLFGPCCSFSGFCGYSSDYCLAGCQSRFGECTPEDGKPITESGSCGLDWGNQTCTGGIFGPCCSTSGFCGSDTGYCAAENCDPEFGTCDEASLSSVMTMSSSSMPMSMASSSPMTWMSSSAPNMMSSTPSSTQMMALSTSSSQAAAATSLCPGANGTVYIDPSGTEYTVLCGMDFAPGSFKILPADDLAVCINLCLVQTDQVCVGVTFGGGQCYFKASYGGSSMNSGVDSAVVVDAMPPDPSMYPSSSAGMVASSSSAMVMSSSSTSRMMASSTPSSSLAASSSSLSLSSSRAAPSSSPSSSSSSVARTTTTTSSSSPVITTTTSTARTTTTTTSSSSSTSSSAYLVLPAPTPCDFGDPQGVDEDDSYCRVTLPFAMRIYTQSDINVFASTNGYFSLTYGSSQYASQQFPASNIPNNTVAPYFDDLYLDASETPKQGIFYQIQGTAVTYEWYVGRGGVAGRIYHFTMKYDSAVPGVFTYTYYSTGGEEDQGLYASIGMQGRNAAGAAVGTTYAYHVQSIPPGLVVVCDTNQNTCVTAS